MTLAFLFIGAACGKDEEGKATNDSPSTVDEVINTTGITIATTQTTVKPTEKVNEAPTNTPKEEKPEEHEDKNGENTYKEEPTESGKDDESDYKSVEEDSKAEYSNSTYSEYEIDLIARTTYLESGNCGEYCQWLTASTILNLADNRGGVANVVYDYNTFNVAGMIDGCSPSDLSYSVARRVASGDRDYNVMAFRASYYHSFGTPYTSADNVYFSTY